MLGSCFRLGLEGNQKDTNRFGPSALFLKEDVDTCGADAKGSRSSKTPKDFNQLCLCEPLCVLPWQGLMVEQHSLLIECCHRRLRAKGMHSQKNNSTEPHASEVSSPGAVEDGEFSS